MFQLECNEIKALPKFCKSRTQEQRTSRESSTVVNVSGKAQEQLCCSVMKRFTLRCKQELPGTLF